MTMRGEAIQDFNRSLIALATLGGTFLGTYLAGKLWIAWVILVSPLPLCCTG